MKLNKLFLFMICLASLQISGYPVYLAKFETNDNQHIYIVANQNTKNAVPFDMEAFNKFEMFFDNQESQQRRTLVLFECMQNKEKHDTPYDFLNATKSFLENSQFNFITTINADSRIFADKLMKLLNLLLNDLEKKPEKFNSENFEKTRDAYYKQLNINMDQYLKYLNSIKYVLLKTGSIEAVDKHLYEYKAPIENLKYYNPEEEHFLETIFTHEDEAIPSNETLTERALKLYNFWNIHYCNIEDSLLKRISNFLYNYDNIVLISDTFHGLTTSIELQKKFKKICSIGIKENDFDRAMLYMPIRAEEIELFFKQSTSRRCSTCYRALKLVTNLTSNFVNFMDENLATKLKEF